VTPLAGEGSVPEVAELLDGFSDRRERLGFMASIPAPPLAGEGSVPEVAELLDGFSDRRERLGFLPTIPAPPLAGLNPSGPSLQDDPPSALKTTQPSAPRKTRWARTDLPASSPS